MYLKPMHMGFPNKLKKKLIATRVHHGHSLARPINSILIGIKIVNTLGVVEEQSPFAIVHCTLWF